MERVYQKLGFVGVRRLRPSVSEERSLVRARLIGSLLHHMLCDLRNTQHYYDTLTALQTRTLTAHRLLAASLDSFFLPFSLSLQMSFSVSPHLSRSAAAAAPQATCYPFGGEQSRSVSGLRRGK